MSQANFSQNRAKKKKNEQTKQNDTDSQKQRKKLMVAREESGRMDEKDGYYNQ